MMPVAAVTRRMRLPSAMSAFPLPSSATPETIERLALVAGPPSPEKPDAPVPASVVMIPLPAATRRIRFPKASAMSTLPAGSTASATGYDRLALVAAPPSPPDPPFPANVVMTPVAPSTLRTRLLSLSAISTWPPKATTAAPDGKRKRALVAGPPSPLNPNDPLPASVEMAPVAASIRRTRWLCISATSKLQSPSNTTPNGCMTALAARPPSPLYPAVPLPARVEINHCGCAWSEAATDAELVRLTVLLAVAVVVTVDDSVLVPVGEAATVAELVELIVLLAVAVDSKSVLDTEAVPLALAVIVVDNEAAVVLMDAVVEGVENPTGFGVRVRVTVGKGVAPRLSDIVGESGINGLA